MASINNKLPKRIERYLSRQQLCCKAPTIGTYRVALNPFCKFLISELSAETITQNEVSLISGEIMQKYLTVLCDKPVAAYTRVNYLLAIRKYLQWEIEQKTILPDAIAGFHRHAIPKVPEYLPKPLSIENDRLIMRRFKDTPIIYSPMFLLLRLTGLRISELINLPKDCIVSPANDEHFLKVPLGKMNNERMVPIHQEIIDIIAIIKQQTEKINPRSKRLIGIDGSVSKVYGRLRAQFDKLVVDIIDQGKPVTFHRLRHTYATTLLSAGVSLPSIMKLLGHRRIEMTLRYAKVVPSHLRNEYLKAIETLKLSWLSGSPEMSENYSPKMDPIELIELLRACILQNSSSKTNSLRNLIRKIDRLKANLKHQFPASHT